MTSYGKGHAAPEWMETFESIEAVGSVYRQKVPALAERFNGVLSLASVTDGIVDCVEDRFSGTIYYRCVAPQEIPTIIQRGWICATNDSAHHQWIMHMLIVRRASISEVRALARQNVMGSAPPIIDGYWYQVQVD